MTDTICDADPTEWGALEGLIESMSRSEVSAPDESYQYTSLPDTSSFRLLAIQPASSCIAPLVLSLEVHDLDDTLPGYEALSYVWGQEPGFGSAMCDGRRLDNISTSLYAALLTLRHDDKERLIWVDALCIRQDDEVEKGIQIRKMHQIYSRAFRVVVWLGRDLNNYAPFAFHFICALVNQDRPRNDLQPATYYTMQDGYGSPEPIPILDTGPYDYASLAPFRGLFHNKWFLRMWVLQEIVLGNLPVVIWGNKMVPWAHIEDVLACVRARRGLEALVESRALQNAGHMRRLREFHRNDNDELLPSFEQRPLLHPFLALLDIGRSFDVSEPRDKVYGLLGFPTRDAAMEMEFTVVPDYKKGVGAVFAEVASKIIQVDGNLDVLSFVTGNEGEAEKWGGKGEVQGITESRKYPDLPSWAPDWTCKTVIYPFIGIRLLNRYGAGASRKDMLKTVQVHPETNMLSVSGVQVATISDVSSYVPLTPLLLCDEALQELVNFFMNPPRSSPKLSLRKLAFTLTAARTVQGVLVQASEELQHVANVRALLTNLDVAPDSLHDVIDDPEQLEQRAKDAGIEGNAELAREALWRLSCYRRGFWTADGWAGLGPGAAGEGDVLAVLWGGQVPVVLRPVDGKDGKWRVVGEAFVEGLMGGEVEGLLERREASEARFDIV